MVTVEITKRALDHIKGTEWWYGFLVGVSIGILAGVGFMLIK